jgi:hypothetical protein
MTREQAAAAIAAAVDAAIDAYWQLCDEVGYAVDPDDLDAPDGLLDSAHDTALIVQGLAEDRGISWVEARQFV